MEGVPRIQLAVIAPFTGEAFDFTEALEILITKYYEMDFSPFARSVSTLNEMRRNTLSTTSSPALMKQYLCQLNYLRGRFRQENISLDSFPLEFIWTNPVTRQRAVSSDIEFEMAVVFYNIGCLYSSLGAAEERTTADSLKIACTHYLCAAWCFQAITEVVGAGNSPVPTEALTILQQLMLAQAQQCILEKSFLDHRNPVAVAKISVQICDYYSQCDRSLSSLSGTKVYSSSCNVVLRQSRIQFLQMYYDAVALVERGRSSNDAQRYGEAISLFQAAVARLEKCGKLLDRDWGYKDALSFTMDVAQGLLNAANRDNEHIYHERIPPFDSLEQIKGACLVKAINFDLTDKELAGPDLFATLIPLAVTTAASVYSEEKAKLLRDVTSQIEVKSKELDDFIAAVTPDLAVFDSTSLDNLPSELIELCASLSVDKTMVHKLVELMKQLASMSGDFTEMVDEISTTVDGVSSAEGVSATLSANASSFLEPLGRLKTAHEMATVSNTELHRAMALQRDYFELMSKPIDEVRRALPSVQAAVDACDRTVVDRLRYVVNKVEEMRQQRTSLESQLRGLMSNDDITSKVLAISSEPNKLQELFRKEMTKFEPVVELLNQNLAAQQNILSALTDANANFAEIRQSVQVVMDRRHAHVQVLLDSLKTTEELLAKANRGVGFYKKLNTLAETLVADVRKLSEQYREELEKKKQQDAAVEADKAKLAAKTASSARSRDHMPTDVDGSGLEFSDADFPDMNEGVTLKDLLPFLKPKSFGGGTRAERRAALRQNMAASVAPGSYAMPPSSGMYQPNPAHGGYSVGAGASNGAVQNSNSYNNDTARNSAPYGSPAVPPTQHVAQTATNFGGAPVMMMPQNPASSQQTVAAQPQHHLPQNWSSSSLTASGGRQQLQQRPQQQQQQSQQLQPQPQNQQIMYQQQQHPQQHQQQQQPQPQSQQMMYQQQQLPQQQQQQQQQYPQQLQPQPQSQQTMYQQQHPQQQQQQQQQQQPQQLQPQPQSQQMMYQQQQHPQQQQQQQPQQQQFQSQPQSQQIMYQQHWSTAAAASVQQHSSAQHLQQQTLPRPASGIMDSPTVPAVDTTMRQPTSTMIPSQSFYQQNTNQPTYNPPFSNMPSGFNQNVGVPGQQQPQVPSGHSQSNFVQTSYQMNMGNGNSQQIENTSAMQFNQQQAQSFQQNLPTNPNRVQHFGATQPQSASQNASVAASISASQTSYYSAVQTQKIPSQQNLYQYNQAPGVNQFGGLPGQPHNSAAVTNFSPSVVAAGGNFGSSQGLQQLPTVVNHTQFPQQTNAQPPIAQQGTPMPANVNSGMMVTSNSNSQQLNIAQQAQIHGAFLTNDMRRTPSPQPPPAANTPTLPGNMYAQQMQMQPRPSVVAPQYMPAVPNNYPQQPPQPKRDLLDEPIGDNLPVPLPLLALSTQKPVETAEKAQTETPPAVPLDNKTVFHQNKPEEHTQQQQQQQPRPASQAQEKVQQPQHRATPSAKNVAMVQPYNKDVVSSQEVLSKSKADTPVKQAANTNDIQQISPSFDTEWKWSKVRNDENLMSHLRTEASRLDSLINVLDQTPAYLDKDLKILVEHQERECARLTCSVAKCSPVTQNLSQDCLPYDINRVKLIAPKENVTFSPPRSTPSRHKPDSSDDDYINASRIDLGLDPAHVPKFIAAQGPTNNTLNKFWQMIWQEQIETIVTLFDGEAFQSFGLVQFWPSHQSTPLRCGDFEIQLKSVKEYPLKTRENQSQPPHWRERVLSVTCLTPPRSSRAILHLHFCGWPVKSLTSPVPVVEFVHAARFAWGLQRNRQQHPVLVHCSNGSGWTGVFLAAFWLLSEVDMAARNRNSIAPLTTLSPFDLLCFVRRLRSQRRGAVQERVQLRHLYDVFSTSLHLVLGDNAIDTAHSPDIPAIIKTAGTPTPAKSDSVTAQLVAATATISDIEHLLSGLTFPSKTSSTESNPEHNEKSVEIRRCSEPISISTANLDVTTMNKTNELRNDSNGTPAVNLSASPIASVLENPNLFSMDDQGSGKKAKQRITKAAFLQRQAEMQGGEATVTTAAKYELATKEEDDPLGGLDPLWKLRCESKQQQATS